jgi:putative intracellular protease/amidase/GNAT superfamily N-acetyltransferase
MDVAILVFDRLTALDAVGPYEVLQRVPNTRVRFVAARRGVVRTDQGLGLMADSARDELTSADVLVVPGGIGTRALVDDEATLRWIRAIHERTTWTTSVCTGSLLLGAAGLLRGREATTHWASLDALAQFGATPVTRRVVEQGKILTAAGVSAGIDMALRLAAYVAGDEVAQAIQLGIEYDPEPPYDSWSLWAASDRVRELALTTARPAPDVVIRRSTMRDREPIEAMFARCTPESRYARFLAPVATAPRGYLERALEPSADQEAWVATTRDDRERVVALGNWARHDVGVADLGLIVEGSWQRQGIGTSFLRMLAQRAWSSGVCRLTASVLTESQHVLRMLHAVVGPISTSVDGHVRQVVADRCAGG